MTDTLRTRNETIAPYKWQKVATSSFRVEYIRKLDGIPVDIASLI